MKFEKGEIVNFPGRNGRPIQHIITFSAPALSRDADLFYESFRDYDPEVKPEPIYGLREVSKKSYVTANEACLLHSNPRPFGLLPASASQPA